MHKITKGLKKKKKGKKSKHKEDELFKPEELEAYRREHQLPVDGEQSNTGQNEEWKKFLQLTSGVDDVLKKTQGDLDRIKSTSFFKRVPPPSEVKRKEEELAESVAEAHSQQIKAEQEQRKFEADAGIVQVSESEEESGEEDDIFDTAYVDAIASGEVKLAYIPESPTEPETDDPFDTSYAERAILGPAVERKGKKLVPLGAAVEVLTGRVQAPTCATKRPVSNRRQILKERDLLLGSFDDNANSLNTGIKDDSPQVVKKTLLDDDEPLPLANEPIDLTKSILPTTTSFVQEHRDTETFIDQSKSRLEQEEDDEFAQLAVESLSKPLTAVDKQVAKPIADVGADLNSEGWNAFEEDKLRNNLQELQEEENLEADPFDTTFAENIVPGKAELKVIENEVLSLDSDFDFNPRAGRFDDILGKVNINVINPSGERESVSSLDKLSEYDLNIIQPIHRDLLGGSNTDLSNLNDQPLKPAERVDDNYIEYCDPFDTSIVETVKLPGQTELKFLEQELLSDIPKHRSSNYLSDDEFDPRAEEFQPKERSLSRPDVLHIASAKTVSFDLGTPEKDLLGNGQDAAIKKPLTPFYVRKNSLPGDPVLDDDLSDDPFDTSFVREIAPCKAELKIIEKELFNPETERHLSISDQDFDPRNENIVKVAEVQKTIQGIVDPTKEKPKTIPESRKIDLLSDETTIETKVLTPSLQKTEDHEISYISDPFDTSSVASNILPGKTELKILETELIHSDQGSSIKRNLTDPEFDPRQAVEPSKKVDLFDSSDTVIGETLSPLRGHSVHFDIGSPEDIDPFDTSIANNLGPGANPFLFNEDDYTSPQSAAVNPFLMDGGDYENEVAIENPFLSQTAATVAPTSTNPFAFDPEELAPAEAQPAVFQNDYPPDLFANTNSQINQNMFGENVNTSVSQNVFSDNSNAIAHDLLCDIPASSAIPQKPTDLDLRYTNTVATPNDTDANMPPPRPPPSKATQDLLMSVMGAMDATSSSLLDKIPPTRTPSPVSMRDLHSPSPTPEPTFGDLLDVSDSKTIVHNQSVGCSGSSDNLLSLEPDINQNQPPNQVNNDISNSNLNMQEPTQPPAPVRPPRPQPPQKPPPPAILQQAPPKPPPPTIPPAPPKRSPQPQQQDDFDMFGVEQSKPTVTSKADILNLYNTQPKQEKPDLLCDSVDMEMQKEVTKDVPAIVNDSINFFDQNVDINIEDDKSVESPFANQEPTSVQETTPNTLSNEPSQNDFQMDTSDSHSKGSASSVTFNPFAASEEPQMQQSPVKQNDVFRDNESTLDNKAFHAEIMRQTTNAFDAPVIDTQEYQDQKAFSFQPEQRAPDEFDAFAKKFDAVSDENKNGAFDAFSSNTTAWGADSGFGNSMAFEDSSGGFGADESFDAFLALQEPPCVPQSTPNKISKNASQESDEEKDFSVVIRPKTNEDFSGGGFMPTIAPPPAPVQAAYTDTSPSFNPFDNSGSVSQFTKPEMVLPIASEIKRTDSLETPETPLFDDDVSQPLEPFPRIDITGEEGWEMQLRQPNKKKITGQRFWKKIFVKIVTQTDCVLLQLYNQQTDKDPFQELPLQPCYSVSEIGAQQYDQFGKIFTLKLQYIFYKERPGVRPGQVKKAERITNKLSQFAAYAIQGDYQGVKEFGSDLKKLGLPVEHSPQVSQLMKLGSLNYEDLKQFSVCIEEHLFKLQAHRDRALHYKMEEVQITAVDELYVEQESDGHIIRQIARVRVFFLGFLTGMPDIELGVNDMRRQGKEVVGRHDIIPVVTEEWIRLENVEFHSCVQPEEYNDTHIIKFKPPDACYIELLRFRIRPPRNRELPLQLKATICVTGTRIELRADVLVPGFASRKLGQIPCEDVMIKFPIPECWIYLFRVEKHFRYGSVKSAHRRTGKIKGIERILGTVETLQESLIEVTSGQAKYEHQHRAIVWRCPRLPKEGQGAYTTHNMLCKLALTSYDQMPEKLAEYCYVEFTMPATQASHTTIRSVSLQNSDSDEPPEKYVRYLARHEYRVGIEHTEGESPNAYASATAVKPAAPPPPEQKPAPVPEESSSDSD